MPNNSNNFCLWCHEHKVLVLHKLICYECDRTPPQQVQAEQHAKVMAWQADMTALTNQLQLVQQKLTTWINFVEKLSHRKQT